MRCIFMFVWLRELEFLVQVWYATAIAITAVVQYLISSVKYSSHLSAYTVLYGMGIFRLDYANVAFVAPFNFNLNALNDSFQMHRHTDTFTQMNAPWLFGWLHMLNNLSLLVTASRQTRQRKDTVNSEHMTTDRPTDRPTNIFTY